MVGWRLPAFCTALGRVLLAGLEDTELDAFLAALHPRALTPQTELDRNVLRARILETRAEGFALVDQEAEIGFRSLAVPLRRYDGRVVAALNLGMQTERGTAAALRTQALPVLLAEAGQIGRLLV